MAAQISISKHIVIQFFSRYFTNIIIVESKINEELNPFSSHLSEIQKIFSRYLFMILSSPRDEKFIL